MPTCRSIDLRLSRSPATCCRMRRRISAWLRAFTATRCSTARAEWTLKRIASRRSSIGSVRSATFGANNGANLYPQEDGSFLVTGTVSGATHYIMMSNTRGPRAKKVAAIRVEAMTDEMLPKFGPGWAVNGNFVLSELLIEAADLA